VTPTGSGVGPDTVGAVMSARAALDVQIEWFDRLITVATAIAHELERRAERQCFGLEPLPPPDGGGTVDALLCWWLTTYSAGAPSHARNKYSVEKHLIGSELGSLRLVEVSAGAVETALQAKLGTIGPQTFNHLCGFIVRAFNCAIRAGRWAGPNPAQAVKKRRVPRRLPDYLRADEVPQVLAALSPTWRPLFATAVYTGLRRGELLALQKADVDFAARLIIVRRSHDRGTTKGDHAEAVPIATELVPFLRTAVDSSPSELVFPKADGTRMRPDVALEQILRRALGRAGIVTGYVHVCRRKGCSQAANATDAALRRCPLDGRKMWPKVQVRPIRFHDLRHTTASLLMMAGVGTAAVQRILRHRDPRITIEVYGHLAPDYLRSEIDRLKFGVAGLASADSEMETSIATVPTEPVTAADAPSELLVTPLLQGFLDEEIGDAADRAKVSEALAILVARHAGVEPATYGSGGRRSIQLS
jgi:integrase